MPVYDVQTEITPAMVKELATNMRAEDVAEMNALGFYDAEEVISQSVAASSSAWAGLVDGKMALIAGVAPNETYPSVGVIWMLATDLFTRYPVRFLRNNRRYLMQMRGAYSLLVNIVHSKNTVSIEWLKSLGFTIAPAEPYGPHGELFHYFHIKGR